MDFLTSLVNSMPGAVAQGLIWGIMAIGVYITYRILDVADLTVDGSLGTGGAVCVVLVLNGVQRHLKKRENRLAAEAEAKRSSAHAA